MSQKIPYKERIGLVFGSIPKARNIPFIGLFSVF